MKKLTCMTAVVLMALGLMASATTQAKGYYQDDIEVDVITDTRGVLHQYPAGWQRGGAERTYVEALDNERYTLRIRNRSNHRVGVVIAVDGRNIISGKKSYLKAKERMYVLGPREAAEYTGWRTARNRVNRFYFTDMDDSYSASWGDYSAMGVIAVAVFDERKRNKQRHDISGSRSGRASQQGSPMESGAGTGIGEDTWSPSRKVSFKPRKQPMTEKFIKYEWRSTLCNEHIVSCGDEYPGYQDISRFWSRDDWGSRHEYAPRRW